MDNDVELLRSNPLSLSYCVLPVIQERDLFRRNYDLEYAVSIFSPSSF